MKVKCVDTDVFGFTDGEIYECILSDMDVLYVLGENKRINSFQELAWKNVFELLPDDAPQPREWMATSERHYVNLSSKMAVWFGERELSSDGKTSEFTHVCEIYNSPDSDSCNTCATGSYADAWAQLVGHKFEVQS